MSSVCKLDTPAPPRPLVLPLLLAASLAALAFALSSAPESLGRRWRWWGISPCGNQNERRGRADVCFVHHRARQSRKGVNYVMLSLRRWRWRRRQSIHVASISVACLGNEEIAVTTTLFARAAERERSSWSTHNTSECLPGFPPRCPTLAVPTPTILRPPRRTGRSPRRRHPICAVKHLRSSFLS